MNNHQNYPHDLTHRLRLLEILDRITQISLASENLEDTLRGVLDLVLEVFNADRAWFLYPCDPDAPSWGVPMERTRPEWPGLFAQGVEIAMDRDISELMQKTLSAHGTMQYGSGTGHPVPPHIAEHFSVKSQALIVLRPKIGKPWMFGLHHCAGEVRHDEQDLQLFTTIAHRISDTLSVLLSNKQLRESEARLQAQADIALQKSERQLREAQSIAHIGSWDYNLATGQIAWSDELYRIYGVSRETFTPNIENLVKLIHPDDQAAMRSWIEACASGQKPEALEFRCIWPDGTIRYIEGQGGLILEDAGVPDHMSGTAQDITERKQAGMELRLAQFTIDHAPDAVFRMGPDGRFLYVNEMACRTLGYSADELLTMSVADIDPSMPFGVPPEMAQSTKEAGAARLFSEHRTKGGCLFPVEIMVSYIEYEGKDYHCAFVRDITERRRTEQELLRLNETLEGRVIERTRELAHAKELAEAASQAKSAFLSNMSHEIRTPMNSIMGMAHLALRTHLNSKQRDYLEKIYHSGEHLIGVIDDILDFSKIEAGKLRMEAVDFKLGDVMEKLVNMVGLKATEKQLRFVVDIDPALSSPLCGDPLRLGQVLINLANNAVKFTEKGEISVHAKKLETSDNAMLVRFEVQDSGIGISKEDQPKLFQSFQQVDTSTTRHYGGTGLGLAISRQMVEMMGGEIGVESEAGKGSTFWFTARLGKSSASPALQRPGMPVAGQAEALAAIRGAYVLLAEDSPFNQQVATELLEEAGVIVCVANNGEEALDLLQQEQFDCVLMDVQMPVMDGFEATRQIRAQPALAGLRVIAMTANAESEGRARCLEAGMDDFLTKPVLPELLYATLARWLAGRQPRLPTGERRALADRQASADYATVALQSSGSTVIDLTVLARMVSDDPAKLRNLALKFLASAQKGLDEIQAALEGRDIATVAAVGHRICSPARTVGALGFADLCQKLARYKRDEDVERGQDILSQLRALLEQINEKIQGSIN